MNESNGLMHTFTHLPQYAALLLQNYLDEYTNYSIQYSYAIKVPLIKYFEHLSKEKIFQISKEASAEFLTYLSRNQSRDYMEVSLKRWLSNELPVVSKLDIEAEDVTLLNHVRKKVLKQWVKQYSTDIDILLELTNEIDDLILEFNTSSMNNYITLLKDVIEEEAHFSNNLINASPGVIFIYDLKEQKELYINGKVDEILGHTPEEVLNLPDLIPQLTHPEDLPVVLDFLKAVQQDTEGKTYAAEYRFKNKKETYHWLRCYAVVFKRDADGHPVQALGSCYEISNEKEIAAALIKREKQLLEAQTIGRIGSYEWDLVKDTSVSTPELRNIFEADSRQRYDEMMQKIHPDDKERVQAALAESFHTGIYECQFRYLAPSGEKFIDARGAVSFNDEKKPVFMIGTLQDVTERKRIEENLIQKTMELERSNEQLQQFASVASHDLKEPLRKIGIFTDIIITTEWDQLSEKTKTNVQKISEASKRMQQLIEGILSYSSLEAQLKKEPYSLQQALEEALNNLELKISGTGAKIYADTLPKATVIPFQIQQLFQNLIANAIKFAKKDIAPEIRITHTILPRTAVAGNHIKEASRYLQIAVSDNGIGFNNDSAEKIFMLFQKLHSKSDYEGSGLGLAICKKVVENHGGTITAHSTSGNGSVFTIILPIE